MVQFDVHTFKPNDFNEFKPQPMQAVEYSKFTKQGVQLIKYLEAECNTITVTRDDETIVVMGVLPLPDNGCHGWLFFADNLSKSDIVVGVRMIDGAMEGLAEMGYEWIQTPVREDFKQGIRMIKMLGFEPTKVREDILEDGTMYKYWMRAF